MRFTRRSTCLSLTLPDNFCCQKCLQRRNDLRFKAKDPWKKCCQPWLYKWSIHREASKVRLHDEIRNYLNPNTLDDNRNMINVARYPSTRKNRDCSSTISSLIESLGSTKSTSSSYKEFEFNLKQIDNMTEPIIVRLKYDMSNYKRFKKYK